jgi:glycosyltransferase involved in cell wall biosynthesis
VFENPHPSYDVFAAARGPTREEARARLGLGGKRVILFFGFVREYKGLKCLLEAVAALPREPGYHLLVAGEFYDDRSLYREGLRALEARGQVTVVDRYVPNEEVALYFSAADVVAAPYLSATQSGVIQVAYGFLRPVIASRVGGIPEAVAEGRTGFLVPPGDAGALAEAIRRFFAMPDPERLAESIREEQKRYAWPRMVDTVEAAVRWLDEHGL